MKKTGIFILIILTLNSCASILNGNRTTVKISADKESRIIYNNDTISINKEQTKIKPIRSKEPLKISVLKDTLKQEFYFSSKLSRNFYLNFVTNYGLGIFLDFTNNRRFTYNKNFHFATDTIKKQIVLSDKKVAIMPKNTFLLYTSPLQAIDFFSIPMATIGIEYFPKDNFSLSVEYGVKIADNFDKRNNVIILEEKAINYRLQAKWYNKINYRKNVHINEYLAIEFRQINSQYNDKLEYGLKNNSNKRNNIRDDFATRKNVTIINLKHGFLIPIGNRFYVDFYGGFGLRIKKFEDIELEFDDAIHTIYDEDDLSFSISDFQDSFKKPALNLSLGFKFGIKL
ncbi:MAG: hypothetical protein AB8B78_02610 [Polaribacter sp.]